MAIRSFCGEIVPQRASDAVHWMSDSCRTVGNAACTLRDKTHNVFRSFLLYSISNKEKQGEKTPLMAEIEKLQAATKVPFVSDSQEGAEIITMISAVYARALTEARKGSHSFLFSTLSWLESKKNPPTIPEEIDAIKEKLDKLWEKTTKDRSVLDSMLRSAKAQATVDLEAPRPQQGQRS